MARFLPFALLALMMTACSKPGETTVVSSDGTKVTASKDGTKFSGQDAEGNKTEWESDEKGGVTATSKTADGKTSTFETGGSTTVTEAELGIPLYPGAKKREQDVDTVMTVEGKMTVMATRFTTDDIKKVFAFYSEKVTSKSKYESADTAFVQGDIDKRTFGITMIKADGGTQISITVAPK